MSPRIKRAAGSVLAASALALGLAAVAVEPAQAAAGYIYVSMPTGLGNCPGGWMHTPRVSIWGNVTSYASDSGDDVVYMRADVGSTSNFVGQGVCRKRVNGRTVEYPASAVSWNVKVDRNNQTIFIGPNGVWKN